MTAANVFCIKDAKISLRYYFSQQHAIQIPAGKCDRYRVGWKWSTRRLVEDGMSTGLTKTHTARWYLWSVSCVRSKTINSLSCITLWLPYITLCYIVSWFFLPLEQSHTALLGCRLASSRGCLLAIAGKLLQLSAYQQARWPFCKLWGEHRFSVPDLVSYPRRVHTTHENYTV